MKYTLSILFFTYSLNLFAQDIHFSQFNNTPLFINPALAGEFIGKARFATNYKNQWGAISSNPYNTYGFSVDKRVYENKLSGGFTFFNDKSGDSRMSNSFANITIASRVKINENNYLKVGLQGGWGQRTIDMTNLLWANQYDGKEFNNSYSTGETFTPSTFNYADIGAGLYWKYTPTENFNYYAGLGAFHLNRPKQSFYSNDLHLQSRYNFNSGASIHIANTNKTILPSIMIVSQSPYSEVYLGCAIKYRVGMDSKYTGVNSTSYITFGMYYHHKNYLIPYIQLIYKNNLAIGMSYDVTLSKLASISNTRGGFELSLTYTINSKNKEGVN